MSALVHDPHPLISPDDKNLPLVRFLPDPPPCVIQQTQMEEMVNTGQKEQEAKQNKTENTHAETIQITIKSYDMSDTDSCKLSLSGLSQVLLH